MRTYGLGFMGGWIAVALAGVAQGAMQAEEGPPRPGPADRLFDRCDGNHDGVIDRPEFTAALRFLVRQRMEAFRGSGPAPWRERPLAMPPQAPGRWDRQAPRDGGPGPRGIDARRDRSGSRLEPGRFERGHPPAGDFPRPGPRMQADRRGPGWQPPVARGGERERPFGFERRDQMERRGPMMPQRPGRPPVDDRPERPPFVGREPWPGAADQGEAFDFPPPAPPEGPGEAERPRERVIAQARQLMRQFDEDGDGQIAYEEFGGNLQRFQAFDRDGDGRVTLRELVRGLQREAPGRPGRPPAEAGPHGERGPLPDADADRPVPPRRP